MTLSFCNHCATSGLSNSRVTPLFHGSFAPTALAQEFHHPCDGLVCLGNRLTLGQRMQMVSTSSRLSTIICCSLTWVLANVLGCTRGRQLPSVSVYVVRPAPSPCPCVVDLVHRIF